MPRSTSLIAVGLGFAAALTLAGLVDAGPKPSAKPRQAAPRQQAEPKAETNFDLETLAAYSTQELRLPRDGQRRAFEAAVTVAGEAKVLDLQPYSMRGPNFQVLVQNAAGELVPTEVPEPQTYRGTVRGVAGSVVAASLIDGKMWATIDIPGENGLWMVQPLDELVPGAPALDGSHVVYESNDVLPTRRAVSCGVAINNNDDMPAIIADGADGAAGVGGSEGGVAGVPGSRILEIGCDADFEYYTLNGSSVTNTTNDIENLLNSVEFIYERDVNITFEITVVVVRSDSADPYTSSNSSTLLNQFANTWNSSPENGIRRDVAHLFTGRNVDGSVIGIAATPSTCFTSSAYSLVQSRYTSNFSLRQSLSAHELGHTLSAGHCDGNGDCHIMCSGNGGCNGISGSNLKFGFAAVNQITNYSNSGNGNCMGTHPASPLSPPFFDDFEGAGVIDSNKWTYLDNALASASAVNEPSGTRSMNLDSSGATLYADDEARTNFINLQGQTNQVVGYYTQHRGVEAGETLTVEYWSNSLRWSTLNVITSDGTDQNNFTYFQHSLPPNAQWSEFRLRFIADGDGSSDDWFIDDVYVGSDPGLVFGACCMSDFTCNDSLTQDQCVAISGGVWQGDNTTCGEVDCTPPLGACCMPDRSCLSNTTQNGCEVIAGGTWQGEGVTCTPTQCLPPTGACCVNGTCIDDVTETQCASFGGTYQNDGSLCSGVSCPQATGACCVPNGDCVSGVTMIACTNSLGGTYQGNGSECGSVNCPQPTGACCIAGGQCLADLTQEDCETGNGGTYQGDNVACGSVSCPGGNTCAGDIVDSGTFQPPPDGQVDGADLAYLLGAWGSNPGSPADLVDSGTFQPPPDGIVDGADLAYLLGAWGQCD